MSTEADERPEPAATPPDAGAEADAEADAEQKISDAIALVEKVRVAVSSWRRALAAATTEANAASPDWNKLRLLLGDAEAGTGAAATQLDDANAGALLGTHADFLVEALQTAARWWANAQQAATASDKNGVLTGTEQASAALDAAMQHALFLTLLNDVRKSRVGAGRGIVEYCQGWGLSAAQISEIWLWLTSDPLRFGGKDLSIALDTVNQRAYRKAGDRWGLYWRAAAPVWGWAAVFALVAALFELLHAAGITQWPGRWVWKLLVLILFVTIGAAVHLGARVLNINYDNPMKIYDAGNIVNWLSLRWIAVVQMYIPITFVVIGLWGANNVPTTFQKLGTAILAGYGADSLIRAAVSKLQSPPAIKPPQGATAAG